MILEQYYLRCLSHASYLIGDEKSRTAVVVDPQRDVDMYLDEARERGLTIRHVFLTHFHADFLAGHVELRDRVGAEICLGAGAEAEFDFRPFGEGDVLEFGETRLVVRETPGHTPEAISIQVHDLAADPERPVAVLTGDALFIGDVGRPDLMASKGVTAEELAGMLYDSLHEKLLKLPDETLVYPAHGAGSLCGKNLSKETVSTIGEQRRYNYALQPMSREDFVRMVTADQPESPDYFSYDAELNRKERPTLDRTLEQVLKPLPLAEVLRLQEAGAQVLDVRENRDFASGHLRGSVNVGLGGQYATWAGTLLDRERPIVIVGEQGQEQEAAMRLGRIGFDHVAGYLEGGTEALVDHPDLVESVQRITAQALSERLEASPPPLVLDVRTAKEWENKHIEGSRNVPLSQFEKRIAEVPRDREVVVHCQSGYRSSSAASLLQRHGVRDFYDLVGGIQAWEASRLETAGEGANR